MKKLFCLLLILTLLFTNRINAEEELAKNAKSAYLIEMSTGMVLFEKNSEEKLYPASMTKMMSLILVMEALNNNQLKKDEILTISEKAASMGGSQVYLQVNEQMSVEDLLKAVCISSANDAMVALAERISGSVSEFVVLMNQKSKELNLVNTNFVNTTGLHDDAHYSCAKDMARIAQKLIEVGKEELLEITSTYDAYIREESESPFWLVNTNKLVKHAEGVDGLKTGFTQEALSCITVTAKKDQVRMIAVVMKEPDSKTRNVEVMEMIHSGFSKVKYHPLYAKNEIYEPIRFENGMPHDSNLVFLEDVGIVLNAKDTVQIKEIIYSQTKNDLPIQVGEKIGELKIVYNDDKERTVDMGLNTAVMKMGFLDTFVMIFWQILT